MKRLFKGGTVVSGERMQELDLLVKGEKILAVGKDLSFRDAEIDNSGTVEDTAAAIWRDFCEHSGT